MEAAINVKTNGQIEFIWDDELADLLDEGSSDIVRVSNVDPIGRDWFADLGLVGGPILGPFALRKDAIAAEVEWLQNNKGL